MTSLISTNERGPASGTLLHLFSDWVYPTPHEKVHALRPRILFSHYRHTIETYQAAYLITPYPDYGRLVRRIESHLILMLHATLLVTAARLT